MRRLMHFTLLINTVSELNEGYHITRGLRKQTEL